MPVEEASPCNIKVEHCCSKEMSNSSGTAEVGLVLGVAMPPAPTVWIPANENETAHQQLSYGLPEHAGLKRKTKASS